MKQVKKIVGLDTQVEAELMEEILTERKIPHAIRGMHDFAFDGLFDSQKGWGFVEAPQEFTDVILEIKRGINQEEDGL